MKKILGTIIIVLLIVLAFTYMTPVSARPTMKRPINKENLVEYYGQYICYMLDRFYYQFDEIINKLDDIEDRIESIESKTGEIVENTRDK